MPLYSNQIASFFIKIQQFLEIKSKSMLDRKTFLILKLVMIPSEENIKDELFTVDSIRYVK